MKTRIFCFLLAAVMLLGAMAGCGKAEEKEIEYVPVDEVEVEAVEIADEAVALSDSPAALPVSVTAVASGEKVKRSGDAVID